MARHEIMAEINAIRISIANHRREWFGMLGTSWEREDWEAKQDKLKCLRLYLLAA